MVNYDGGRKKKENGDIAVRTGTTTGLRLSISYTKNGRTTTKTAGMMTTTKAIGKTRRRKNGRREMITAMT